MMMIRVAGSKLQDIMRSGKYYLYQHFSSLVSLENGGALMTRVYQNSLGDFIPGDIIDRYS